MQKKLTITIDERVYEGLYRVIGARKISQFIEKVVRPYTLEADLSSAYEMMAEDLDREKAAIEWSETLLADASHEAR